MNRMIRALFMISFILILTGCWDYLPLEEKYIITTVAIDRSEQNPHQIMVTTMGITYKESNEVLSAEGSSIIEAMSNIRDRLDKNLALTHLQAVLFSESIAGESILPFLDVFYRDSEVRSDAYFFVVKGQASDFLAEDKFKYPIDGEFFRALLVNSDASISEHTYDIQSVIFENEANDSNFTLPTIAYDAKQKMMEWDGVAIFANGKMVGELGKQEAILLWLIGGKLKQTNYTFKQPSSNPKNRKIISLRLFSRDHKIQWKVHAMHPSVRIEVEFLDEILEISPWQKDKLSVAAFEKIESDLEREIHARSTDLIRKLQTQFKLDVIGLRNLARVKWPEKYVAKTWNDQFSRLEVKLSVNVQIERTGILY
jgi:spore germination protein KC